MITLHPDEKIIIVKRRHWLPITLQGVSFFILGASPFIFVTIINAIYFSSLPRAGGTPSLSGVVEYIPIGFFISIAWAFFAWIGFFVSWTNYYLDILAITNKRIIDIEQIGLFARDIAELRIEHIEDIKVQVVGLVASLLHFGNLHIQSAGSDKEIILRHIPNPHKLRETISKLQEDISRGRNFQ
jgi:hypothetical protein